MRWKKWNWTIAVRVDTITEQKFLLSERESLIQLKSQKLTDFKTQTIKLIELQRKLRKIQEKIEKSEEYLEEVETKNRITYLQRMVRDATRPIRDEIEETIRIKDVIKEELLLLQNQIGLNSDKTKLIRGIEIDQSKSLNTIHV